MSVAERSLDRGETRHRRHAVNRQRPNGSRLSCGASRPLAQLVMDEIRCPHVRRHVTHPGAADEANGYSPHANTCEVRSRLYSSHVTTITTTSKTESTRSSGARVCE